MGLIGLHRVMMWGICMLVFIAFAEISMASSHKDKVSKEPDSATEKVVVQQIKISGNKTTKERIIIKELAFGIGDTIDAARLDAMAEESKNNLLNTSLFNFVYINFVLNPNRTVVFDITVEERWYLWAFPLFEQSDRNVSSFIKNGNWDMMNYGMYIRRDNFRGRQETVKFRLLTGYSTQFSLSFQSPEYKGKVGWGVLFLYNMFDHVAVSTINDKPVYLKTPGNTLYSTNQNQLYLQYRHNLYSRHQVAVSYQQNSISDSVRIINQNFLGSNSRRNSFVELSYMFTHDTRDSKVYPLKGLLQSITLTKYGLGSKSEVDYANAVGRLNFYQPIGSRFDFGTEFTGVWGTNGEVPYFNRLGFGYKDNIAGYEYHVADGPTYALLKNRFLYELVPTKVKHWDFIPLSKFSKIHYTIYLRAFYESGYVWNQKGDISNQLLNKYLYGYGAGIDLVTFYDKAFSCYYAFNSIGQGGLFFNLLFKM
ncbi:MAG: BamA/TamA family outer membrane protein [Breznakibacter sp.]